jgi:hypothetical protein
MTGEIAHNGVSVKFVPVKKTWSSTDEYIKTELDNEDNMNQTSVSVNISKHTETDADGGIECEACGAEQ